MASRLNLSSKCPPGVLEDMEVPDTPPCGVKRSNMVLGMFCESFMTIGALKGRQDSSCPPSVLLESWRTWMFLTHLEMVSRGLNYPQECFLQVWSWLVDKKPVKTLPVLQVSSWSLGGHGCSWDTWSWCQKGWDIPRIDVWRFYMYLKSVETIKSTETGLF